MVHIHFNTSYANTWSTYFWRFARLHHWGLETVWDLHTAKHGNLHRITYAMLCYAIHHLGGRDAPLPKTLSQGQGLAKTTRARNTKDIWISVHSNIWIYVYKYIYTYMYIQYISWVYVCMYVYIYIMCMCKYIYIYVSCVHVYIYIYHVCICTNIDR